MPRSDKHAQLLEQFMQPERLRRLDEVLAQRTRALTIVLDRVRNYHNISAVIRSADAFGLMEVQLIGEQFGYSPKITQGTERWLTLVHHNEPEEAVKTLKKRGYDLVVLQPQTYCSPAGPAVAVSQLPFERPLALVFGSEKDGVSRAFTEAADIQAFIPMKGFVESLNISVACAICLFCSTISAAPPPARRTAELSALEREQLRAEWLKLGVKRSEVILREVAHRRDWSETEE